MDRFRNVILVAGLGCFALSFVLSGVYPYLITDARSPESDFATVTTVVSPDFRTLKEFDPAGFVAAFPAAGPTLTDTEVAALKADDPRRAASEAAWQSTYADAVHRGRDVYISEACWHCHSQYVRPVGNEEARFGPIRTTGDDNNAAQRPVLWGTRRVGPDLTNEGGLRSNDWHAAHLFDPKTTSPGSIMPRYPWYFQTGWQIRRTINPRIAARENMPKDRSYAVPGIYATEADANAALATMRAHLPPLLAEDRDLLHVAAARGFTRDGFALVAYLQWLGTWHPASGKDR